MNPRTYNALFLCTGNSARSILAEAILDRLGGNRIRAYSAGSHPTGRVHPMALELLEERGHDVSGLRSKSWSEFEAPGAPALDFIFTVCDSAADEACPIWPGRPVTAHWGVADPAAFEGSEDERRRIFERTYMNLLHRIELFTRLPIGSLDRLSLEARLEEIGKRLAPAGDGE
jgi:protein-tyrosine-phosphatase